MRPFWLPALLAPLLMALEVTMDLAQPRLLQRIVDVGIANRDAHMVLQTGLHMMGIALVGFVGGVGCTVYATIAALHFGTAIRQSLFERIQQLSFGNLDRLQTGGLITRVTNDVDQVQEAALMVLRILVRAPLLTIGSLIMAVLTAPKLSVILLIIGPLMIGVLVWVNQRAQPMFAAMQARLDRLNTIVQEALSGVRVVKAFVREPFESSRFSEANQQFSLDAMRAMVTVAAIMPSIMLLISMGIVAVLWFGGVSVHRGELQVGQLLAFINYLFQMLTSLMMVSMLLMRMARADASAQRILDVLHEPPDVPDPTMPTATDITNGRVEFDGVTFRYGSDDGAPVLRDIHFSVESGQMLVILGATGSGKSTLVHLIPRLYDVTEGAVRVDGQDVRNFQQDVLRKRIALVLQETILFSGTIAENLRYARPEATDAELREAARMAQAESFIDALPDGFETVLGQRGVNLSGGQKQRLALARALVAKPVVLILDDCTSAVDMSTERLILQSLYAWDHRCTRIVVAQRVGAAMHADSVLVLENGAVAAFGTHEQLMQTSEVYRDIVHSQFSDEELARVDT